MDRLILLMLAGLLAGLALMNIPLEDTFLASIVPITDIIGVLSVLVFSLFLIYKGITAMFSK
ncbi:hypothetical protein [Bacillus benzoevorans]|uniref:Uncharacterized protein n=1 Tax=Bacillus benzoevorans TaxID=1456 RepID=A0A7X0HR23_9BACI|nr:hypothetical protein [Bacillus benzoevorans]MBB6445308.1 hypothetical protein [Bacillus benzoevorans]